MDLGSWMGRPPRRLQGAAVAGHSLRGALAGKPDGFYWQEGVLYVLLGAVVRGGDGTSGCPRTTGLDDRGAHLRLCRPTVSREVDPVRRRQHVPRHRRGRGSGLHHVVRGRSALAASSIHMSTTGSRNLARAPRARRLPSQTRQGSWRTRRSGTPPGPSRSGRTGGARLPPRAAAWPSRAAPGVRRC